MFNLLGNSWTFWVLDFRLLLLGPETEDESWPPEGVNLKETSILKYIISLLGRDQMRDRVLGNVLKMLDRRLKNVSELSFHDPGRQILPGNLLQWDLDRTGRFAFPQE